MDSDENPSQQCYECESLAKYFYDSSFYKKHSTNQFDVKSY